MKKYLAISHDKCAAIGFLEPKKCETQSSYIIRLLLKGFVVTTRDCRFIEIANLHSVIPVLKKKGYKFTLEHKKAYCHTCKETPPYVVDVIYMSNYQRFLASNEKLISPLKS